MMEEIVQMTPMVVLAGLAAAWLGDAIASAGGYGFLTDMAVSLAGSVLGGVIFWAAVPPGVGMVTMFLAGCVGGALALLAQRTWWRSAPARA